MTNMQTFIIKYDHINHSKQLENLRELIRGGEMRSVSDLVAYCNYKAGGYKDQMHGLELVPTFLERYI